MPDETTEVGHTVAPDEGLRLLDRAREGACVFAALYAPERWGGDTFLSALHSARTGYGNALKRIESLEADLARVTRERDDARETAEKWKWSYGQAVSAHRERRDECERLREALELLDRELIEEDGTCHSAGEGLVERWAEVVSKALGREDTDGNE